MPKKHGTALHKRLHELRSCGRSFKKNSLLIGLWWAAYHDNTHCVKFAKTHYRQKAPKTMTSTTYNKLLHNNEESYRSNLEYNGSVRWIRSSRRHEKRKEHRKERQAGRQLIHRELHNYHLDELERKEQERMDMLVMYDTDLPVQLVQPNVNNIIPMYQVYLPK